jgi:hypothetical protein
MLTCARASDRLKEYYVLNRDLKRKDSEAWIPAQFEPSALVDRYLLLTHIKKPSLDISAILSQRIRIPLPAYHPSSRSASGESHLL